MALGNRTRTAGIESFPITASGENIYERKLSPSLLPCFRWGMEHGVVHVASGLGQPHGQLELGTGFISCF